MRLFLRVISGAIFLCHIASSATAAEATRPQIPRIAFEDDADATALRAVDLAPPPFPVVFRVALSSLENDSVVDARLAALEKRQHRTWLAVPAPSASDDVDRWRTALRALLDRHGAGVSVLEIVIDRQPARLAAFATETAATEARSKHETIRVAIGGDAMRAPSAREQIYTPDLAPYVDLLAVPVSSVSDETISWLKQVDPAANIAITPERAASSAADARQIIEATLQDLGSVVAVHSWHVGADVGDALKTLSTVSSLLADEVSPLDDEAVGLTLTAGDRNVTGTLRHRLLFDTTTFATYLAYWGDKTEAGLEVSLLMPVEGVPGVHDLVAGTSTKADGYQRDQVTTRVTARTPVTGRPMLIDFNEGASEVVVERSGATAERQLTVAEIIARHQQQQRAQDAVVRSYMADALMEQHFRPTVTDPGYDVVTENRYFVADDDVEWEELSFSVNGSKWGADRPPFPMLQPEKVLSLPLQLRFDEGYRYRLAGTERVDGFDCYAIKFEPLRADAALYRGTVWIDRRTFARVRVQAVQGGLTAPVVSNEETQHYSPVTTVGNQPVFLFSGLTARQIVLLAGRNLLVEKSVRFANFRVNDADFEEARGSARDSNRIMYRETDRGLRYYLKQDGKRIVSERPTRSVKAMAMGVTIDPSYRFPLPIFGIDYLDFEFGKSDSQLALLFGGVLAAGNIQKPAFGSKKLDASVDFFAIAAPSSDRIYGPSGENEAVRVLTWPLSSGLNLGWQATPFLKASLQYQLRFDGYTRDTTTSDTFQVPSTTLTNGIGGAWEYRRAGYSITTNAAWYARSRWKDWGGTSTSPTYAKYSAGISRDFYVGPFQKLHLNAAWFGGHDLDRFSDYQFGMFDDTRIHGVPASGVRFPELAMVRGSYSFNVFDQYRLDLFVDHGWGRDSQIDTTWQRIPGFGTAINFRAPWNTILRADVGKSILPARYGQLGSMTLQILLLKPLK